MRNNVFFGNAELVRQRVDQKNNDEKIERVERPAQKTGQHRVMGTQISASSAIGYDRHSAPQIVQILMLNRILAHRPPLFI